MRLKHLFVFTGGLLFGFGLAFGGMSKQEIVLSFLQLKDLGLLLLLGGSAFVTALTINLVPKALKRPFLGGEFKEKKAHAKQENHPRRSNIRCRLGHLGTMSRIGYGKLRSRQHPRSNRNCLYVSRRLRNGQVLCLAKTILTW